MVAGIIWDTPDVDGARRRAASWEEFLRSLIRKSEGSGITVMRSGVVGDNTRRPLDKTLCVLRHMFRNCDFGRFWSGGWFCVAPLGRVPDTGVIKKDSDAKTESLAACPALETCA